MRRRRTIFSLPGLILLAVLLAGLSLVLWRQGGLAFNPGALSAKSRPGVDLNGFASHAEFERECAACHQPFERAQAELCVACHTNVADQISAETGPHGKLEAAVGSCWACHSDHRGREFDPGRDALDDFDHALAEFALAKHQLDYSMSLLDCASCHLDDAEYSVSIDSCTGCHGDQDREFMAQHLQDFGDACLDCHDGIDRMADFDHNATDFPLSGEHLTASCAACHQTGEFSELPVACVDCHEDPAMHAGIFSEDCSACHNPQAWEPALLEGEPFDHTANFGFSLARHARDYDDQSMTCASCHGEDVREFQLATCSGCHADHDQKFVKEHQAQFGGNCLECHDGIDRMRDFDHASVFPLEGRHGEIECSACHVDEVFKGTPQACVDCHAEPEIHAGFFGLDCQYCHTTVSWSPARLRNHNFPLDHGEQGESACQTCHPAVYAEYTCYGCHEHEPAPIEEKHREEGISLEELPECITCHPSGREAESEGGN